MAKKPARRRHRTRPVADNRETCFVICPYDNWHNQYCEVIYNVAIEAAGLKPRRADDLFGPSPIMGHIWKLIRDAKIVLADVTGRNANVLYELGLAHAIAKPAVLLTASMDDVPFDLKNLRVLLYDVRQPSWADDLGKRIRASIEEVLDKPELYVPLTYIEERPGEPTLKVNPKDREKLEIEQRLQSLALEVRALRQQVDPVRPGDQVIFGGDAYRRFADANRATDAFKGLVIDPGGFGRISDLFRTGGGFKGIAANLAPDDTDENEG